MDDFPMNPNRHWWHLHCWLWKDSFPSGFVRGHRKWDGGIRRKNGLTPHYMNESCWKTLDQTGSRYRNLSIDVGNNGCPNSIPGKEYVALCFETYMNTNLSKILLQFNKVLLCEIRHYNSQSFFFLMAGTLIIYHWPMRPIKTEY